MSEIKNGGISIGSSISGGTEGSVLFIGPSGALAQDNSNFFWDNTNNCLGIGTNSPEIVVSQTWVKTVTLGATVSVVTAGDAGAYGSLYDVAQSLTYKVVGYVTHGGVTYYMTPTPVSNTQVIVSEGDGVSVSWSASDVNGYILIRDFDGDGYASYYDAGSNTNLVDDNGNSFAWTTAAYPTTPNTLTFNMYGNSFDPTGLEYLSVTDENGFFFGGTGIFYSRLGVGTGATNPTPTALIISSDVENTYPGVVLSKDNAGLGTGNNIEFGRCGLVVHNPNTSSQTMMAFTTGSISSPTVLGGLRVDHNGSYSWEALSTAGHYFWAGGIGTQHICGFFSINGNASGYGLTVGSSTAPTGDTVFDVYGTSNFRNTLTATNLTDSALTAGRVVFAGTGGLLSNDADFTFSVDTLTITKIAATTFTGNVTLSTKNIVTDTTTGSIIATGTTQKLGFFNATPVVQQGATTDLGTALSNLGLRAAGTAYPITTSGAVQFTGGLTVTTANITLTDKDIVLGTTTGSKLGTSNTQKIGFWNATPVIQSTGWTTSNVTTDKVLDANATSLDEVADVLCSLIEQLKTYGLLGA